MGVYRMSVITVAVPKESAMMMWDDISPFLSMALDYSRGEVGIDNILEGVLDDKYFLVAVFDEKNDVISGIIMEVRNFPKKKACCITLAGGTRMEEWYEDVLAIAEKMAKNAKAQAVYITGRRGWVRQLSSNGYEEYYTTIGKELEA